MVCPVTVQELPLAGPGELGPPPRPVQPSSPFCLLSFSSWF